MSRYKEEVRRELNSLDYRLRYLGRTMNGFTNSEGDVIPGLMEEVELIKAYLQITRCDPPALKKFCKAATSRKKGAT